MAQAHVSHEVPAARRFRVVVLGGGFAGVYTAIGLERALERGDGFEIALVNRESSFVFQAMLPEVISGSIGITDVVSPLNRLLPRTTLTCAHEIECDHLGLALGNVTDFRRLPGLPELALPFKKLGDALALRNHAILCLAEAREVDATLEVVKQRRAVVRRRR